MTTQVIQYEHKHQTHDMSSEDDTPYESPFDPEQGIWFKYGRLYADRALQLEIFEAHCGFKLPEDFLGLIQGWCEGGFEGWWRVKQGEFGRILWSHLLLMKLPDDVDREAEQRHLQNLLQMNFPGKHETKIVTDLLEARRRVFFGADGRLRYFPFGEALCLRSDDNGETGYLAFDVRNHNQVVFITGKAEDFTVIARSFSAMMLGAVFESHA